MNVTPTEDGTILLVVMHNKINLLSLVSFLTTFLTVPPPPPPPPHSQTSEEDTNAAIAICAEINAICLFEILTFYCLLNLGIKTLVLKEEMKT